MTHLLHRPLLVVLAGVFVSPPANAVRQSAQTAPVTPSTVAAPVNAQTQQANSGSSASVPAQAAQPVTAANYRDPLEDPIVLQTGAQATVVNAAPAAQQASARPAHGKKSKPVRNTFR